MKNSNKIKLLVKKNLSINDIAEVLNLSYNHVTKIIRQMDLETTNKSIAKYTAKEIELVGYLRHKGVSYKKIGEILNIPIGSVNTIISRYHRCLIDEQDIKGYLTTKKYLSKYNFNHINGVMYWVNKGKLKTIKQSKFRYFEDIDPRCDK